MADEPPAGDGPPKRSGRRPKITDTLILSIASVISEGSFRYVAGRRFGVPPGTFKRWLAAGRRFPEGRYGLFRAMVLEAEAAAEHFAVAAIIAAGTEHDAKHLQWWLERKFPQRWGRGRDELSEIRRALKALREESRADADGKTPS